MENDGGGVEHQRLVGFDLGIMPTHTIIPNHGKHVVTENGSENHAFHASRRIFLVFRTDSIQCKFHGRFSG